jgi:hypothetical protein
MEMTVFSDAALHQSGWNDCGLIFEPRTSRIRNRSANNSTTTFGDSFRMFLNYIIVNRIRSETIP